MRNNIVEDLSDKKKVAALCTRRLKRDKTCVLFIEDDRSTRVLLKTTAMSLYPAYDIEVAETSAEGVEAYFEYAPDIIFFDINLPDGNGLELMKVIRKHDAEAYLVMLTSYATSVNVKQAVAIGVNGFIVKPFTRSKLEEAFINYTKMDKSINTDILDRSNLQKTLNGNISMEAMMYESFLNVSKKYVSQIEEPDDAIEYINALSSLNKLASELGANRLANLCYLAENGSLDIIIFNETYVVTCEEMKKVIDRSEFN